MNKTEATPVKAWIVVSPQEAQHRENVGTYGERFGWLVKNAETGYVHSSGDERNMRRTARTLNRVYNS